MPNAEKTIRSGKKSKPDDPEQSKHFINAARDAEADETEKGADHAFKKAVATRRSNTGYGSKNAKP